MQVLDRHDERNAEILSARMASLDEREGPRVGDYVRFADDVLRRISYEWTDGAGWHGGFQTSGGGSFHLGDGFVSFSGALYPTVPLESLTLTDERREGWVWIEHHGYLCAGSAVNYEPEFRVYTCNLISPR